jgi:hypothetical protein
MKKLHINRRFFRKLDQEQLSLYVRNLLGRCPENPEMQPFAERLHALHQAITAYDACLLEAVPGGRDRTTKKRLAKATVYAKLDALALAAELADLPETLAMSVGFVLKKTSGGHSTSRPLAPPQIESIKPLGDGAIKVAYRIEDPNRVYVNLFEWSGDGGVSWQLGYHARSRRVRWHGLPQYQKIVIRIYSLGAAGRRSGYSQPAEVFVI